MRILIDFTQIPLTRTGVGVYADHLVEKLIGQLAADDLLLILLQDDETSLTKLVPQDTRIEFHTIPASIFRNRLALLLYEQTALPWLAWRKRMQVVHSLHYTFPLLARTARVVTIHDLIFFLWPQFHTRGRLLLFKPFIRMALRLAEGVVFVSKSTAQDAGKLAMQNGQVRRVTPLGVRAEAFVRPLKSTQDEVLGRLKLRQPFLLFVGTIEPRKNVLRLIEAFEKLAEDFPGLRLVLAGKVGWDSEPFHRAIAESSVAARIDCLGFVTDAEKQVLLASAAALVYPSMYEGFGLPVLEAMAIGTPVVTSNVSSLLEVAGEGALLVDPASLEQIAEAIRSLLNDPNLVALQVAKGLEQARTFTWERTAKTTYETYRSVVKG
jgi:glycosyltransferase involved in cell wall biosynthesis